MARQIDFLIGGLTDSSGNPLAAGKVYTYSAGTTTPKTTWQDAGQVTSHANPIILDGEGKKLAFANGLYKIRIDDADDVTQYTLDNLNFGQAGGLDFYGGTAGGSANALTLSTSPALLALTTGVVVNFIASATNTSASTTVNVNGLGAVTINKTSSEGIQPGDIIAGYAYTIMYESSSNRWFLLNPGYGSTDFTITPTSSAGTASAPSTSIGKYTVKNKRVSLKADFSFTLAGASAASVTFPAPFGASVAGRQVLEASAFYDGATLVPCTAYISGSTITVAPTSAFTVGAGRTVLVGGDYYI